MRPRRSSQSDRWFVYATDADGAQLDYKSVREDWGEFAEQLPRCTEDQSVESRTSTRIMKTVMRLITI